MASSITPSTPASMNRATDRPMRVGPSVHCPNCGKRVFDGFAIRCRVVRLLPKGAQGMCECKSWVALPIIFAPINRLHSRDDVRKLI